MARRHPCDTCGADRRRWQRICDVCWRGLPHAIRTGIVDAWRTRQRAAHRDWVRQGKAALAGSTATDAAATYHRTAARMGERD